MAFIVIAEPSSSIAVALRRFLEHAHHEVSVATTVPEALERVRELAPSLLISSVTESFDGEALCRQVKSEAAGIPVLLLYLPEEEQPESRAAAVKAEACLVGPLKRATVVSCVSLLMQLARAREAVAVARTEVQFMQLSSGNRRDATGSAAELEFLKRLLFAEVKRSRRYRYPISYILVEPDRYAERLAPLPVAQRTAALAEVLGKLSEALQDIDVAVPFAEGRFIVFLPYTPTRALVVAERLRQRVKEVQAVTGLTASIGMSVFEPSLTKGPAQVSFGSIMKEAGEALRKAQAGGGDRIEGGRPMPVPETPPAAE